MILAFVYALFQGSEGLSPHEGGRPGLTCSAFLHLFGLEKQVGLHLSSSFGAAFIASVMSNPVDVAKTRLMNQRQVEGEPLLYKSTVQTMSTIVQQARFRAYNSLKRR